MENEFFLLIGMREGDEGIVRSISGGKGLTSRLAGMGIIIGTPIRVMRNSGGGVIVLASETRVALGRKEASFIEVERTSASRLGRKLLVALAGQPNVGKSTIFNILTGLSQHVGNWPGKTVEKKEGVHASGDVEMHIVDLPGTYGLTSFSEEERVARDFVITEHPDVVVLVVNASALERSLYLLSELLLLDVPVILAVNMVDVAESQGIRVDVDALHEALGIPAVQVVATKNAGIRELLSVILGHARGEVAYTPHLPPVSADHRSMFVQLSELVREHTQSLYPPAWAATKLMEGDPDATAALKALVPEETWNQIQALLVAHEDALRAIVGGRYDWIEEVTRAAISRFRRGQVLVTDRIDHVLTRPLFGVPVLLAILGFVFLVTFTVGFPAQDALERVVSDVAKWIGLHLPDSQPFLKGLLVTGIIGGTGSVLTFLPILLIFFACLGFLEDVGYMARAAFVMDRFMHIVGLHGKSFLPMCLGFGCNVPSVVGARIVESRKARLLTIFLTPFIPCTARLAVLTFVSAAVFGRQASLVSWGLVSFNIIVVGLAGIAVSRLLLRGEAMPFIMELPLYHKPDLRTIGLVVMSRTVSFVRKAGTVILAASVAIWFLSAFPTGNVDTSLLSWIGRLIEPVGRLMGLGWREVVALLSSVVAKENAIAALAVLYGVGEEGQREVMPRMMSRASALSFLVFLMLFVPCAATVAVMRQEMKDRKWFLGSLATTLVAAVVGGIVAFHVAPLLPL